MTFTELKRRMTEALACPNTGNKLAATLALNDYAKDADHMRAALQKIASDPGVPVWIARMAHEGLS